MKMKIINFLKSIRGETLRYIIIGGCTTLVNFAVFTLMLDVLKINFTVSNITAIAISILFAYVTNKLIVFRSRCKNLYELLKEAVKFVSSRLITMGLEVLSGELLVTVLGQPEYIGKLESQIIVIIGNYFISKFLVFRKREEKHSDLEEM